MPTKKTQENHYVKYIHDDCRSDHFWPDVPGGSCDCRLRLDAILSRLFDLPRVLRHRRSGVRTGVGELGILLGLGAGISAESCQDSSIRLWLVVLVFVGLVMRFIGEAASKDIEQS